MIFVFLCCYLWSLSCKYSHFMKQCWFCSILVSWASNHVTPSHTMAWINIILSEYPSSWNNDDTYITLISGSQKDKQNRKPRWGKIEQKSLFYLLCTLNKNTSSSSSGSEVSKNLMWAITFRHLTFSCSLLLEWVFEN